MALPNPGNSISLSQINTELGRSSSSQISLNIAEDGGYVAINQCSPYKPSATNPATFSEWYRYNHTEPCSFTITWTIVIYYGVTQTNSVRITKNGVDMVDTVEDGTGSFSADVGDSIVVYAGTTAATGLNAYISISKDSVQVQTASGNPSTSTTYSFTVSSNHSLSVYLGDIT